MESDLSDVALVNMSDAVASSSDSTPAGDDVNAAAASSSSSEAFVSAPKKKKGAVPNGGFIPPPAATGLAGGPSGSDPYDFLGNWDPANSPDWDAAPYPAPALLRIKKDIWRVFDDPPQGIVLLPRQDDMASLDCLIMGPSDTPYEGGFFFFYIRCPPNYPICPPRVRLMTTGGGTVRFNPNLYSNGKVCLSLLGTWSGPAWSPALGLSALVLSIQSLMSERPYHNEPGLEKAERFPGDSKRYNRMIRHETLRVAVCGTVKDCLEDRVPEQLKEVVIESFMGFYETYVSEAKSLMHLDGQDLQDPYREHVGRKFAYRKILKNLEGLHKRILDSNFDFLKTKNGEEAGSNGDDDSEISESTESNKPSEEKMEVDASQK